jgi:hypothetical protein
MGNREIHTGFLARKPKGKRPHGKHRRKWEDNIKTDLKELGGMDWIYLAQGGRKLRALVNTIMSLRVP